MKKLGIAIIVAALAVIAPFSFMLNAIADSVGEFDLQFLDGDNYY